VTVCLQYTFADAVKVNKIENNRAAFTVHVTNKDGSMLRYGTLGFKAKGTDGM